MSIQKLYKTDTFSDLINKFNENADEISSNVDDITSVESLFGGGGQNKLRKSHILC